MTAVESCPNCGRVQRKSSLSCDSCRSEFDHRIAPPPRIWPVLAWRSFVVIAIALLFLLVARTGWVSQVIVEEASLELLVAKSPVIVLARRIGDRPLVIRNTQTVHRPDGSVDEFSAEFQLWQFEIIEGYRHLYRSALPRVIYVVNAYADQDAEILRAGLEGYSVTYGKLRYVGSEPHRLADTSSDPVILFLNVSHGLDLGPDQPDNLFMLQYEDSIEGLDARESVVRMIKEGVDDPEGPSPPSSSE